VLTLPRHCSLWQSRLGSSVPGGTLLEDSATAGADNSDSSTNYTAALVDNGLTADAGPDQSVNLGSATSFSGSYTDNTGGTVSASGINWDFNYDGTNFVADPAGAGIPTPSYPYYVGPDNGTYTSSSSPTYLLPSNISSGQHTVSGYVEDSEGATSPVYTWTGQVQAGDVTVVNNGTGQVQLNWTGSGGAVTLNANQSYQIAGTAPDLTMTLLTSGATYNLATNGTIASINAASGVTGVTLSVSTQLAANGFTTAVGDGSIGAIDLPGGGSTVSVNDRGDLGSIQGPTTAGLSGASALDLVFMDLTGSISGLDTIESIQASGWLGTSASQVVDVNRGVGSLSAYGVGATVDADELDSIPDPALNVTVGYGGVPGAIDAGRFGNVNIQGDVWSGSALRLGDGQQTALRSIQGNYTLFAFGGPYEQDVMLNDSGNPSGGMPSGETKDDTLGGYAQSLWNSIRSRNASLNAGDAKLRTAINAGGGLIAQIGANKTLTAAQKKALGKMVSDATALLDKADNQRGLGLVGGLADFNTITALPAEILNAPVGAVKGKVAKELGDLVNDMAQMYAASADLAQAAKLIQEVQGALKGK
jgi:hypothetical protein